MALPLPPINSRADLDGLDADTRAAWLERLARTLWRLERDDANQRWIAVEDTSTLARFGFTAEDFPQAPKPELPEWLPLPQEPAARVSALQGLLAIDAAGLAAAYESWANDPARSFAERAFIQRAEHWVRDDPTLQGAATALGLTETQLDELFIAASKL